ncbi:CsbD family protein [Gryllotalpicola koreensis]|uniref:CsbD-like domain-containing protein n=1 Tax=Gryllotalpicola koreensis TaxID=993086 RepID=A0ABP8A6S4_9MICO
MSMEDKGKHQGEDLLGKGKEAAGKLTDDEKLENEGRADQVKAGLKKAGDQLKDAFHDATDKR